MNRSILHCDMNNFYASVECMLDPSLRKYPVAVCGSVEERHGIVLAKNYAAKAFDVKTGDAVWQAKQKCKDLVIVPPHYEEYIKYSKLARSVYSRFTDQVEPYGIATSRGTVGDDIKALQELGVEIEVETSTQKRFSLIGRRFDLPELKTLIDAVESARFIPKEKSAELVRKLGSLTSLYNTSKLIRNVDVENRIKSNNEKIYYIMEALNDAINDHKKVSFQYFTFNVRKEQKLKHDGFTYVLSPYKLIWNGDYYYVVGYSEKHEGIGIFRVDRIARFPKILEADAVLPPKDFDINIYLNSMFRMYSGDRKQIELVCDNNLMDAIVDKFGQEVTVLANDMKSFRAIITTATGPVFYSWVFGFGGHVSIKAPEDVKEEYTKLVLEAAEAVKKTQ